MQTVLTNSFIRKRLNHRIGGLVACLVVTMLSLFALTGTAAASTSQKSVMQDDGQIMSSNDEHRNAALDEMAALGVDIVKVGALWRTFAHDPNSNSKPNIDTSNPANYSWGALQAAVNGILARGMTPWVMVTTPGPNWAAAKSTSSTQEGVYQPDPAEFGKFAQAIATQFPQVNIWSEGNEPNFQYWLWPQVGKGNVSLSAIHYRKMYIAARDGLRKSPGTGGDQILFGGLAPRAFLPKPGQRATQPITFLQDFFCLDKTNKPLKGAAAKARQCTGKYKKIDATGFAYHPYTVAGGPGIKPTSLDDAPIAYLKRVYRVLDKAAKYKRLSKRKIPLWNGEFGYQSDPPDTFGTSISKIPGFLNASEYLSYKDSRVKTYHQFQLIDDASNPKEPVGSSRRYAGFQSGLRFEDGSKKFGVYNGYELPLMVFKTAKSSQVSVWGGVRAKVPAGTSIELQVKSGGGFTTIKTLSVGGGKRYFKTTVSQAGAAGKSYRFILGKSESRTTKPGKLIKASSK